MTIQEAVALLNKHGHYRGGLTDFEIVAVAEKYDRDHRPPRHCANEVCDEVIITKRAYCSDSCLNAQNQRQYRRRLQGALKRIVEP